MSWSAANDYCQNLGATLPCVQNSAENDFLFDHFGQVWLGINDQNQESKWEWLPSCQSTYSNWHAGEPNDWGGPGEDCAAICGPTWPHGRAWDRSWADLNCNNPWGGGQKAVCEFVETDQGDETDQETSSVLFTVSPNTVPSYAAAAAYCEQQGQTLARIFSAQQQVAAASVCGNRVCYIDLAEHSGRDGDWQWSDGTAPTYTNWSLGEPNNYQGVPEKYAVTNHGGNPARGWDDYPDVSSNYALCSFAGDAPLTSALASTVTSSKEFTVSQNTMSSYSAAATYCLQQGQTLARMYSAEQAAIAADTCGPRVCYIDLAEHSGRDGDWKWSDGTTPTYTNWAPGEPNNYRGVAEKYAVTNHGGNPARGWDDYPDVSTNYALCSPVGASTPRTSGFQSVGEGWCSTDKGHLPAVGAKWKSLKACKQACLAIECDAIDWQQSNQYCNIRFRTISSKNHVIEKVKRMRGILKYEGECDCGGDLGGAIRGSGQGGNGHKYGGDECFAPSGTQEQGFLGRDSRFTPGGTDGDSSNIRPTVGDDDNTLVYLVIVLISVVALLALTILIVCLWCVRHQLKQQEQQQKAQPTVIVEGVAVGNLTYNKAQNATVVGNSVDNNKTNQLNNNNNNNFMTPTVVAVPCS